MQTSQHTFKSVSFKSAPVRFILSVLVLSLLSIGTAFAEDPKTGAWVEKKYGIDGGWSIEKRGDEHVISFSDDFKTKGGPDLKVFLSPQSIEEVTGRTATVDSIMIDVLKNTSGSQEYVIPASIDVSQFKSVLIHCEAYSVLWGGANL